MRVSVIGAGPAGAMAAGRLARAGARVTLVDPSHPREKPCGGGVTGRALALAADLVDVAALPMVVAQNAIVDDAGRATRVALTDAGATPRSSLVVISRAVFDHALARAAVACGARLLEERAVEVRRCGARMIVRTEGGEHEADAVLGADGATSLVRKTLARPFSRAQLSVAAGYFVAGAAAPDIAIRTMREQPGYLWSFPRPDHLAVGVCAAAAHRAGAGVLRAQSAAWIRQHAGGHGALTPYAWPIPSVGHPAARPAPYGGPGWMLVGDAAGLVDPQTREGIYYALLSGVWAADALAAAADPGAAAAAYTDRLRAEVEPELARAARLSGLFFTPAFASLLVRALDDSDAIRQVFVDLVAGAQPYRGLRRRLLGTGQWGLAARAIPVLLRPRFASTMRVVALPQET